MAASAATVVPALIPDSGTAVDGRGNPLTGENSVTFLVYKDEKGGEPLLTETHTIAPDLLGHYTTQLGASLDANTFRLCGLAQHRDTAVRE